MSTIKLYEIDIDDVDMFVMANSPKEAVEGAIQELMDDMEVSQFTAIFGGEIKAVCAGKTFRITAGYSVEEVPQ